MRHIDFSGRRSTPMIMQSEASECGLACLAMVAGFHRMHLDMPGLRSRFSSSLQGITLQHLMLFSRQLNFQCRPLRIELKELNQLRLPAILHWNFNHFVVLTRVKGQALTLHDPSRGKLVMEWHQASPHFTGIALELTPDQEFTVHKPAVRLKLLHLLGKLPGIRLSVIQILLLALALEFLTLLMPWFTQLVLDDAIVSGDRNLLHVIALGFLLLVLFKVVVEAVRSWVVLVLGSTVNLQLLSNLFRKMLNLPYSFFERRHLGDIVSRFESMNVIQRTLTHSFLEAVIDGLMAFFTAIMMLIYSIKLSCIVILATVCYLCLRTILFAPLRAATEEKIHRSAIQHSNLLETVRGIQSIKLFNRITHRNAHFQNLVVDHFNADVRYQKLQIVYRIANNLIFSVENILVIWIGALLILDQHFSVGMLIAFLAYKEQFSTRTIALIEKAIEYKMLGLHSERVSDIALTEPERANGTHDTRPVATGYRIEIKALNFSYADTTPLILQNLNLNIEEGECVAIIGASGCGKTTLMKLLLGLLSPVSGEIMIDGINLQQIDIESYRDKVGAVLQDDHLFAGSIADNICFFAPESDREHIMRCAKMACIHDDIMAMPMHYNTLIGDMGGALSGGQQQRILLARALYKNPKILLLDEATSHLDVQREKQVNDAIKRLDLTRIIIAHRPETIASAKRVILLQQGYAHPCEGTEQGAIHIAG
ncbi:peptidase domain-containing ABC transporter [Ketobacter sp.]